MKLLDEKMMLDPFEERFDLPTGFVLFANGRRWRIEQIGRKDEWLLRVLIIEANAA